MRSLIIISVILAVATSEPEAGHVVAVQQDTQGNYNIQYAVDGISRVEQRTVDGHVHGGFSFVDPHGVVRKTVYNSGQHGFHAFSPDIPTPVQDTAEVALAKAQHLALLRGAHLANGHAIVPETRFALPADHRILKTEITPSVSVQSLPVSRFEKIETDVPVVRPSHFTLQSVPVESQIPTLRTSNLAFKTIPLTEKLVETSPLLRSGQLTFESVPVSEKVLKTEIPVFRSNIALESIPLTEKFIETDISLLKSSPVAEKVVKTEIPVFRTANLELKSVPVHEQFIKTDIPLVRSGEVSLTQARIIAPIERLEIPRSSIALDPVRVLSVGDNAQILKFDNDHIRKILFHQQ